MHALPAWTHRPDMYAENGGNALCLRAQTARPSPDNKPNHRPFMTIAIPSRDPRFRSIFPVQSYNRISTIPTAQTSSERARERSKIGKLGHPSHFFTQQPRPYAPPLRSFAIVAAQTTLPVRPSRRRIDRSPSKFSAIFSAKQL